MSRRAGDVTRRAEAPSVALARRILPGVTMRIRSPRDFWAGLVFIAIAAAFIWLASGYRYGTAQRMGPGFFPICGRGLPRPARARRSRCARSCSTGPRSTASVCASLLVTLAAVVLFGVVLTYLGLVAAIVVLVVVGALADPAARPLRDDRAGGVPGGVLGRRVRLSAGPAAAGLARRVLLRDGEPR